MTTPTGATLSGTLTCTSVESGLVEVVLGQREGRYITYGFGFKDVECDGTPQTWTIEVTRETGPFRGGKAFASVWVNACIGFHCAFDSEQVTVRLRH